MRVWRKVRPNTTLGTRTTKQDSRFIVSLIDENNPFKLPDDEQIFTFKDDERKWKALEREKNKRLMIWEKNVPARRGKLRQICEIDIVCESKDEENDPDDVNIPPVKHKTIKENRY